MEYRTLVEKLEKQVTLDCLVYSCPQCHGLSEIIDVVKNDKGQIILNICSCND